MIIKMYVEGNVQNQMFTLQMSQVNNLSSTEPNFKKKKKNTKITQKAANNKGKRKWQQKLVLCKDQ